MSSRSAVATPSATPARAPCVVGTLARAWTSSGGDETATALVKPKEARAETVEALPNGSSNGRDANGSAS